MNTIINGVLVEEGSGNVYADLGYPDADLMLAKAELAPQLQLVIDDFGITQSHAAEIIDMPEDSLSAVLNGKFRNISTATFSEALARLNSLRPS
ncbi:helix-turn-helix domain-containing protein [Duganella sp. PWIR1]